MKYKRYFDNSTKEVNLKSALWIAFWVLILFTGNPDIHDAIMEYIGRH